MRALSSAVVVLAGAICIAAEVQTSHLHGERWGILIGLPVVFIGVIGWILASSSSEPNR